MMNILDKHILITGAHGFLGKHVVACFQEKKVSQSQLFLPSRKDLDLCDKDQVSQAVQGKDIVIHLAGIIVGRKEQVKRPADIFHDNLLMNMHILEACRLANVKKLVTIGSITQYPAQNKVPLKEEDIWNGYPDAANAPYAVSKRILIPGIKAYKEQYGLNGIHLILPNLYGPGDKFHHETPPLVPSLIKQVMEAKKNNAKEMYGGSNGRNILDLLYVRDAAQAIYTAVTSYDSVEPLNIGSGSLVSIQSLTQKIADIIEFEGRIEWGIQTDIVSRYLDITKARTLLEFTPSFSLEEGLRATIHDYQTTQR